MPSVASSSRGAADLPASPKPSPKGALVVAILGSSMAFADSTVVNVALPVMQRELSSTVARMQWVVEAYALFLSSLVLVGGALGDRYGRRRIFSAGVVLFSIASAACGVSPSSGALVFARAVQGIGAALLVPGSLALISAAFGEKQRGAAIGTWSAASAITSSIGPVLGGWVVAHASWRWLFFINVPIGAAVVLLAARRVEETRDPSAPHSMDWLGAACAALGLGLVVHALLETHDGAVLSARSLGQLGAGVAVLAAFILVERRQQAPMVPPSLFRSRAFAGTNLMTLFLYAGLGGALFFIPFELIAVAGYTPTQAGASLLPLVLLISALSRWAGALVPRIGARLPLVVGPLVAALGFALLTRMTSDQGHGPSTYFTTLFPGVVVLGLGMGMTVAPLTTTVMGAVSADRSGVASGINNAVARTGGLLAIAIFGVVLTARFDHILDARLEGLGLSADVARVVAAERSKLVGADLSSMQDAATRAVVRSAFETAFASGVRQIMLVSAALAVLSALTAFLLLPRSMGARDD